MRFYEEIVLAKLGLICLTRDFQFRELGRLKNKELYPFYSVIINDNPDLPTIVYSCGIHGNEIAPVYAGLEFLNRFEENKFSQFRFIIFPAANPTGFNNEKRNNYLGHDLNHSFQRKELPEECQFMVNEIAKVKNLIFFGAFHEDLYSKGKYFMFNYEKKPQRIYRDLVIVANSFIPSVPLLDTGVGIAKNGLITNLFDKSIESKVFFERGCFSICSETPTTHSLKVRILCNLAIMKAIPHLLVSKIR